MAETKLSEVVTEATAFENEDRIYISKDVNGDQTLYEDNFILPSTLAANYGISGTPRYLTMYDPATSGASLVQTVIYQSATANRIGINTTSPLAKVHSIGNFIIEAGTTLGITDYGLLTLAGIAGEDTKLKFNIHFDQEGGSYFQTSTGETGSFRWGTQGFLVYPTGTTQSARFAINGNTYFGPNLVISPSYILSLDGQAARTIGVERNTTTSTAGVNLTIVAGGAKVSGSNLNGGDLYFKTGQSTGSGTSAMYWQLPTIGGAAGTDGTYTTRGTLLSTGWFGLSGTPTSLFEGFTSNSDDKFRFGTNLRSVFGGATGMGMEFSAPSGNGYGYCGIYQRSYSMYFVADTAFKFGTSPGSSTPQVEFNFTGGTTQPRYMFGMGGTYDMNDSLLRVNASQTSATTPTYAVDITNKRSGVTSAAGVKITVDGSNSLNNTGLYVNITGGGVNYGIIVENGVIGLGVTTPSVCAKLDITSTTQGLLLPRMTTTQKNAISTPVNGLMVYDTTLGKACVYTSAWETITSL